MPQNAWNNEVVVDPLFLTDDDLVSNLETILAHLKSQRPRYTPPDYPHRRQRLAQEAHWLALRLPPIAPRPTGPGKERPGHSTR